MNRYRMRFAPGVWTPMLNPTLVKWLRPLRRRQQINDVQLEEVEVHGEEIVRDELTQGHGVMINPNHASHADPFAIYAAADQVGTPLHVMATWHVFHKKSRLARLALRFHGCFSVDREANDLRAFRLATDILRGKKEPLVIFPEGEIYHCNDRVTPFREGAAAIAVAAARKADRKIVCIPCAITYRYKEDPTPQLLETMRELEEAIFWRCQDDRPLEERIYRFAEGLLALKELEYFHETRNGPLPDRICELGDHILRTVEKRHGLDNATTTIPERIKAARRTIILKRDEALGSGQTTKQLDDDLEDLFLVVQSFSYPGDYVVEKPTIERMAETLDKFEEDVLRHPTASIKAKRRAEVRFGEPIDVVGEKKIKGQATALTSKIEASVQEMLDVR